MKLRSTSVAAILTTGLLTALGSALPASSLLVDPEERIPNATFDNAYPRWLPYVLPYAPVADPLVNEVDHVTSVAVDSRNCAHVVVWTGGADDGAKIFYANNVFQTRNANGFGEYFEIGTGHQPDIWVDTRNGLDEVHVVYEKSAEIWYRKKTAAGWQPETSICVLADSPEHFPFGKPQIMVDKDGHRHVFAGHEWSPSTRLPAAGPGIVYIYDEGAPSFEYANAYTSSGVLQPDIRFWVDNNNTPWVVWNEIDPTWAPPAPPKAAIIGAYGSYGGAAKVPLGGYHPDICVESPPDPAPPIAHIVTLDGYGSVLAPPQDDATTVSYQVGFGGSGETIATWVPNPIDQVTAARVRVDSRGQVHAFWHGLNYAAKVKNPGPGLSGWVRQDPLVMTSPTSMGNVAEVAVSVNDQFHVIGGYGFGDWYGGSSTDGYYTRTMEYGLGTRDAAAMAGVFPGATLNTTSGNLHLTLPLLSLKAAVTPVQSLSLVYNSLEPYSGFVSPGWKFNYEIYLIDHWVPPSPTTTADMTLVLADGRPVHFQKDGANARWLAEAEYGVFDRIERVGSTFPMQYKLITKLGEQLLFGSDGKLIEIKDLATGNYITLGYTSGRLTTVTDMLGNSGPGRTVTIEYEAGSATKPPRAERILPPVNPPYIPDPPTSHIIDLKYTSSNHLREVEFPNVTGGAPTFAFDYYSDNIAGHRINLPSIVRPPRGTVGGYGYSCSYFPDGRFKAVQDPQENVVGEGADDPAALATPVLSVTYADAIPPTATRETTITWRRQSVTQGTPPVAVPDQTRYLVEPRRSLALQVRDATYLAGTSGIFPVVRTFNSYGLLTEMQDRWGFRTKFTYQTTGLNPDYVLDNLDEIQRPVPTGPPSTDPVMVKKHTYTSDGLNRLATVLTKAISPADGAVKDRITTYTYEMGQVKTITWPPYYRPDAPSSEVTAVVTYTYGSRRQVEKIKNEDNQETEFISYPPQVHALPTQINPPGAEGSVETFIYDVMGNVRAHTLPSGGPGSDPSAPTAFNLDALFRVTSSTDPLGKVTAYEYDLDSNLTKVTPPSGAQSAVRTDYDKRGFVSGGNIPEDADPNENPPPTGDWSQSVDAAGNVRRVQNVRGFISKTEYDVLHRAIKTRIPGAGTAGGGGPALHITEFVPENHSGGVYTSTVTQKKDDSWEADATVTDRLTTTTFDNRGRAIEILEADGSTKTRTIYDEQDQVVATELWNGGTEPQSCSVFFRDARDRVHQVRRQKVTYVAGQSAPTDSISTYTLFTKSNFVQTVVNGKGIVTATTDPANKTEYVPDSRNRVWKVKNGYGAIVEENLYGDDDLVYEKKILNPAIKESPPSITWRKYTYTARKELKSDLNAATPTSYGRSFVYNDTQGQVSEETIQDGAATLTTIVTTYYPKSQLVNEVSTKKGAAVLTKTKQSWTAGLLSETQVWNPATQLYDAAYGRTYDQASRLEKLTYPSHPTITTPLVPEIFKYNSFAETKEFAAGTRIVALKRDKLGQPTLATWASPFGATVAIGHDAAGNRNSVDDGTNKIETDTTSWKGTPSDQRFYAPGFSRDASYVFDDALNLETYTDPEDDEHRNLIDDDNRQTGSVYGAVNVQDVVLTDGGLVDTITRRDYQGYEIAQTTVTHNSLGLKIRERTVRINSGGDSGQVLADFEWIHDTRDRIEMVKINHLGIQFNLGYDDLGNLSSESNTGNGGGLVPPYFANPPLGPQPTGNVSPQSMVAGGVYQDILDVAARSASYTFDAGGNRTGQTIDPGTPSVPEDDIVTAFACNGASQLTSESTTIDSVVVRTVAHSYDGWGNETLRVTVEGGVTTEEAFGYNHLNLTSTYAKEVGGIPTATWQYLYWPTGERYGKVKLAGTGTNEYYVPRFGDVACDYDASLAWKNSYVQGAGIDSKVTQIPSSGGRRHFVGDQVGTVSEVLSDTGSVLETRLRDVWGNLLAEDNTPNGRYGFAQREHDDESGFVHMRWRQYDPKTGRFLGLDPLRGNRPFKHYLYGSNSPSMFTDPWGLEAWSLQRIVVQGIWNMGLQDAWDTYAAGYEKGGDLARASELAYERMSLLNRAGGVDETLAGLAGFGEHFSSGAAREDLSRGISKFGRGVRDSVGEMVDAIKSGDSGKVAELTVKGFAAPFMAGYALGNGLYDLGTAENYEASRVAAVDINSSSANVLSTVALLKGTQAVLGKTGSGGVIVFEKAAEAGASGLLGPRPGKLGGQPHRTTTAEVTGDITQRGNIARPEYRVETPEGAKQHRYVDVAEIDPATGLPIRFHQVGKQTQSGLPVSRERRAIGDIEQATGIKAEFHPYNAYPIP